MVNIMVVDDEKLICEGLKKMIEHLNISEVKDVLTSSSSLNAIELAKKNRPDIVITDICMPDIDGLELIEKLKVILPRATFIVLSGFDQFSYVKRAFKLGSIDYLLKPAGINEIEEVIIKAIDKIAEQLEDTKLDEKYSGMVSEKILNSIFIDQEITPVQIEEIFINSNIHFKYINFSVSIIYISNNYILDKLINKDIDQLQSIKNVEVTIVRKGSNRIICIYNFQEEKYYSAITESLQTLMDEFKNQNMKTQIVLSDIRKSYFYLNEQYILATKGFNYKIFYPQQVILMNQIRENSPRSSLTDEVLKDLRQFIKERKIDKISYLIDLYFVRERLIGLNIGVVENMFHSFLLNIAYIYEGQYLLRKFSDFESLADLRIYLKHVAFNIIDYIREFEKSENIIEIAKRYIQQNYHKNISLAEVSNIVSMNYSYFSKFFKKETGLSYVEYLTKIRMEEAKRLLGDPTNKVYEVSIKVGYENSKYFTRTFKNYFGASPKDYKVKNRD